MNRDMSERDGGPAFPHDNQELGDKHRIAQPGMSLRDYFAGQALAGMGTWTPLVPHTGASLDLTDPVIHHARARWAYAQADAMLSARTALSAARGEGG